MDSVTRTVRGRSAKLRSHLDELKREVSVASCYLQSILDNGVTVVERLESLTSPQAFLKDYSKVNTLLSKYYNKVTEVTCSLEILDQEIEEDYASLTSFGGCLNSSSVESFVEGSVQDVSSDQVFRFSATKKEGVDQSERKTPTSKVDASFTKDATEGEATRPVSPQPKHYETCSTSSNDENEEATPTATSPDVQSFQSDARACSSAAEHKTNGIDSEGTTSTSCLEMASAAEKDPPCPLPDKTVSLEKKLSPPKGSSSYYQKLLQKSSTAIQGSEDVKVESEPTHQVKEQEKAAESPASKSVKPPSPDTWTKAPPFVPKSTVPPPPPGFVNLPPSTPNPAFGPPLCYSVPDISYVPQFTPSFLSQVSNKNTSAIPLPQTTEPMPLPQTPLNMTSFATMPFSTWSSMFRPCPPSPAQPNVALAGLKIPQNPETKEIKVKARSEKEKPTQTKEKEEEKTKKDLGRDKIRRMNFSRDVGKEYQVAFDHMVSPGEFYVQILCPELSLMREMTKEIETHFKTEELGVQRYHLKNVKHCDQKAVAAEELGAYAMCYMLDDPCWTRAEVIDWRHKHDDDLVTVLFIDYGDTKNVSLQHIQPIPEKFYKYPAFAERCHLTGIYQIGSKPQGPILPWAESARTMLEIILDTTHNGFGCKIKICPPDKHDITESLPVLFYLSNDEESVNEKMVRFEMAVIFPGFVPWPKSVKSVETVQVKEPSSIDASPRKLKNNLTDVMGLCYCFPKPPSVGEVVPVTVTCLLKINRFYCVRDARSNEADNILQRIVDFVNKKDNVKDMLLLQAPPVVGQLVVGKYKEDNLWYRAKVVRAVPDTDEYKLLFVDYGNTELVTIESIRQMERKFLEFPFQMMDCNLQGIEQSEDVSFKKAIDHLYSRVHEGGFSIKIVSVESDVSAVFKVNLYDQNGADVGSEMVSKLYAKYIDPGRKKK